MWGSTPLLVFFITKTFSATSSIIRAHHTAYSRHFTNNISQLPIPSFQQYATTPNQWCTPHIPAAFYVPTPAVVGVFITKNFFSHLLHC